MLKKMIQELGILAVSLREAGGINFEMRTRLERHVFLIANFICKVNLGFELSNLKKEEILKLRNSLNDSKTEIFEFLEYASKIQNSISVVSGVGPYVPIDSIARMAGLKATNDLTELLGSLSNAIEEFLNHPAIARQGIELADVS
jgi:hypothetical protein